MASLVCVKGCPSLRLCLTFLKTPHTRPCVGGTTSEGSGGTTMVASPMSTRQRVSPQTTLAPLSTMRTETVLSRFPMHHRTTREWVTLPIRRPTAHGACACRWAVSYNAYDGPPRPLASHRDTIGIHQLLAALLRPLPRVLTRGSRRPSGTVVDVHTSR